MAAIRGLDTENSHDFSDLYKGPQSHARTPLERWCLCVCV